jgi:hypothetical protein
VKNIIKKGKGKKSLRGSKGGNLDKFGEKPVVKPQLRDSINTFFSKSSLSRILKWLTVGALNINVQYANPNCSKEEVQKHLDDCREHVSVVIRNSDYIDVNRDMHDVPGK